MIPGLMARKTKPQWSNLIRAMVSEAPWHGEERAALIELCSAFAYNFAAEAWGGFESGRAAHFHSGAEEYAGEDHQVRRG